MVQKNLKKLLKHNYYYKNREWQYKDIKPRIVVEKLLLDENSNIPNDHKIFCFNGHVVYIEIIMNRYTNPKVSMYDPDWNFIEHEKAIIYKPGKEIEKPKKLAKMKSLAETLAKNFRFVRVDLYNVGNNIYFGEMTFSPVAGFESFPPPDLAKKLNIKLKL